MQTIFVIMLLVIFYISQLQLSKVISQLVSRLGGGERTLIWLWSLLLLPGTMLHEISHFFAAAATGARTGKIEIFPDFLEDELIHNRQGKHVVMGYVQTQKLNLLQGFLVGFSPFIFGLSALVVISSLLSNSYQSGSLLEIVSEVYLFFAISNTMFPSRSDYLHTFPLIIISLMLLVLIWYLGIQFVIDPNPQIISMVDSLQLTILISLLINVCLTILLKLVVVVLSPHRR